MAHLVKDYLKSIDAETWIQFLRFATCATSINLIHLNINSVALILNKYKISRFLLSHDTIQNLALKVTKMKSDMLSILLFANERLPLVMNEKGAGYKNILYFRNYRKNVANKYLGSPFNDLVNKVAQCNIEITIALGYMEYFHVCSDVWDVNARNKRFRA